MEIKINPEDPRMDRGNSIGSIMIKVLMKIVLIRFLPFYESHKSQHSLRFALLRGVMISYMSSGNSGNRILLQQKAIYLPCWPHSNINRYLFLISTRNCFSSSDSTICLHLRELHLSIKPCEAGEEPNSETFQTPSLS